LRPRYCNILMMTLHKKLKRRTFLQDRFEILIKKQQTGQATFNELTELDEIVNRDAFIREQILEEMQGFNGPAEGPQGEDTMLKVKKEPDSLITTIKSFFGRLFTIKSSFDIPLINIGIVV